MNISTLLILFKETFMISMFTVGGGYVIVPLMKKKFVDELEFINDDEMMNMIAIAQSSPGALAVNVSIILGYKLAGIVGGVVSCFATALPPLIVITVISSFYEAFKSNIHVNNALIGMASGVSAIIVVSVIAMIKPLLKKKSNIAILIISAIASIFVGPIVIIISTIILSIFYTLYLIKKENIWFIYNFL